MKSQPERLNEQLERGDQRSWNGKKPPGWLASPTDAPGRDPEIDELVTIARHWQSSPLLQADRDFSELLERRLLLRQALLHRKQPSRRWFLPRLWRAHPVFSIALGLCLLVLFLGANMLVVAAQVSNPENPLYALRHWEQHVQISLASSPESRAELDLQFARERLGTLADLANAAHAGTYQQVLASFDQQLSAATSAIQALPVGPDSDRLSSELTTLEVDARHTLRGLLPQLAPAERLVTTDELGRLGDTVPRLLNVEIVLSTHLNGRATINMTGDNIQPGALLLVNEQVMEAQGIFQNGLYVFTLNWNGDQHPQSIGILNPDNTVAQTTAITMKSSSGIGNGNGNNGGHGNGTKGNKPNKTPTPHH
jgi:Domain of unknown function (DUF5667)